MLKSFFRWFQAPRFTDEEDKTRHALLLNILLNTCIIALPVILVGVLPGGPVPRYQVILRGLIIAWLLVTGLRDMMLAGRITMPGIMLISIIFLLTTFSISDLGTIRAPATAFYFLVVVTAGLIVSKRAILWIAGVSTLTILGLLNAEIRGLLPRLREVFENLIENAAKFMADQANPLIEIGMRGKEDSVSFIKDKGIGIEPQYHQKIFGLFERPDPAMEGTGIGLALVKRIIEIYRGRISVKSECLGKGSTFCFTIPNVRTR